LSARVSVGRPSSRLLRVPEPKLSTSGMGFACRKRPIFGGAVEEMRWVAVADHGSDQRQRRASAPPLSAHGDIDLIQRGATTARCGGRREARRSTFLGRRQHRSEPTIAGFRRYRLALPGSPRQRFTLPISTVSAALPRPVGQNIRVADVAAAPVRAGQQMPGKAKPRRDFGHLTMSVLPPAIDCCETARRRPAPSRNGSVINIKRIEVWQKPCEPDFVEEYFFAKLLGLPAKCCPSARFRKPSRPVALLRQNCHGRVACGGKP